MKVSGTPVVRFRTEHVLEAWHVCNLLSRHVTMVVNEDSIEFLTPGEKWTTDFSEFVKQFTPSKIESLIKQQISYCGSDGASDSEDRETQVMVACVIVATVLPTWAAGALAHGSGLANDLEHPNEYCADWFHEQKEKFQNL